MLESLCKMLYQNTLLILMQIQFDQQLDIHKASFELTIQISVHLIIVLVYSTIKGYFFLYNKSLSDRKLMIIFSLKNENQSFKWHVVAEFWLLHHQSVNSNLDRDVSLK